MRLIKSDSVQLIFAEQSVGGADQFGFAIGGVRAFAPLFSIPSIFEPHIGTPEQTAVISSPCSVGWCAALAAEARCSTSNKPGTVFVIHTTLGPFCNAMGVASSPAVRDSVAKRRTIPTVDIAGLGKSGFYGASRIAANTGTRFLTTAAGCMMIANVGSGSWDFANPACIVSPADPDAKKKSRNGQREPECCHEPEQCCGGMRPVIRMIGKLHVVAEVVVGMRANLR